MERNDHEKLAAHTRVGPVPARPVCTVGPHTYAEGEKFKDRCNTCTCNAVNAVSCTDLVCL